MAGSSRDTLLVDLAAAAGWAVFVGFGIALGLALGSAGADVPADGGMLVFIGLIAAAGTLVVRLVMVAWKHGRRAAPPPRPAPRPTPTAAPEAAARAKRTAATRPSPKPAGAKPAPAKRTTKPRKPTAGGSITRRSTK